MSSVPRPAPARHSAIAAAFPSLSIATGTPSRFAHHVPEGHVGEGDVHRPDRDPGALVDPRGHAESDRDDRVVEQLPNGGLEPVQELLLRVDGRSILAVHADRPVAPDEAGEDLRSADVDTDDVFNHERRLM